MVDEPRGVARIFWFNAECEAQIAHGRPGYTAPGPARALLDDLEALPMFFADAEDGVLVRYPPRSEWLDSLARVGFAIPRFVTDPGDLPGAQPQPWSPSPDAERRLGLPWPPAHRTLAAKTHWVGLLAELLARGPAGLVAGPLDVGRIAVDPDEALAQVAALRREGVEVVVLKAPWGNAGRGAIRVLPGPPELRQRRWIERTIDAQGAVLVEPWRRRLVDLSVLLEVRDEPAGSLTVTRFFTDERGRYLGTSLAPVGDDPDLAPYLAPLTDAGRSVARALRDAGYDGLAGVDAMVFAPDAGGPPLLKPLLEVNARATMGHVALALGRRVATPAAATWHLIGRAELAAAGASSFHAYAERIEAEEAPLLAPDGRLRAGVLFTNDPLRARVGLGVLRVAAAAVT